MIKIRSMKEGFRRAGHAFSKEFQPFPDDWFTPEQIDQLKAEPMIEIQLLPDLPKPNPEEEAMAREVLMKMTLDKLRSEADAMGLFFDEKMKKADLVELILKSTAPAPEA